MVLDHERASSDIPTSNIFSYFCWFIVLLSGVVSEIITIFAMKREEEMWVKEETVDGDKTHPLHDNANKVGVLILYALISPGVILVTLFILYGLIKLFNKEANFVESISCGMGKSKRNGIFTVSIFCLIVMIGASSLGAFEGHAKIKDYIILNELGEAKDISASQDLKKPAGVIQFKAQETFVDFKKGTSIEVKRNNEKIVSCAFPIVSGTNGISSQQIIHYWTGGCAEDVPCCRQYHEKKTLCAEWSQLNASKTVPYGVLYMSPSCSFEPAKKAAMTKSRLTSNSVSLMLFVTDNATKMKGQLLGQGIFACTIYVGTVSLLHLLYIYFKK